MDEGNTYTRSVIFAMSLSLATVLSARGLQYVNEANGKRIANPLPELGGAESFFAWGVILVALVALADAEPTGALGASFAWLIFLAVLYTYGISALDNLRVMMGAPVGDVAAGDQYRHRTGVAPR